MKKQKNILSNPKDILKYLKYAEECGMHLLARCVSSDRVGNWYLTNTKYFISIPNFNPEEFESYLLSLKKQVVYHKTSRYFFFRREDTSSIQSMLNVYLDDKTAGYNVLNYRSPYESTYSLDGNTLSIGKYQLELDDYLVQLLEQEKSCYSYTSPSFQQFHSDKPSEEEYDAFRLVIGNYTVYTILKTKERN